MYLAIWKSTISKSLKTPLFCACLYCNTLYLEDFKDRDDLIIMFTDAYDILFYKNKSEIISLFMEFNANVVFGAEEFLTPIIEGRQKYPKVGKKGKFELWL